MVTNSSLRYFRYFRLERKWSACHVSLHTMRWLLQLQSTAKAFYTFFPFWNRTRSALISALYVEALWCRAAVDRSQIWYHSTDIKFIAEETRNNTEMTNKFLNYKTVYHGIVKHFGWGVLENTTRRLKESENWQDRSPPRIQSTWPIGGEREREIEREKLRSN